MPKTPPIRSERSSVKRKQKTKLLILCEDKISSPSYFTMLINARFRGITRQVDVKPADNPTPDQVLKSAKNLIDANHGVYNHVYCVIDRDEHDDWHNRLRNFTSHKNVPITPIVS